MTVDYAVGDPESTERGSGARTNGGKPALHLLPWELLPLPNYEYHVLVNELAAFEHRQADIAYTINVFFGITQSIFDWPIGETHRRIAEVLHENSKPGAKYKPWNWAKGMPWSVPIGSAKRHLLALMEGEELDEESGLHHAALLGCNLVFLAFYVKYYPEGDDRIPANCVGR